MTESSDDRLFTLAEAEAEIAKRDCLTFGHDIQFDFNVTSFDPLGAFCARGCGAQWAITRVERAPSAACCVHPRDEHTHEGCGYLGCGCRRRVGV